MKLQQKNKKKHCLERDSNPRPLDRSYCYETTALPSCAIGAVIGNRSKENRYIRLLLRAGAKGGLKQHVLRCESRISFDQLPVAISRLSDSFNGHHAVTDLTTGSVSPTPKKSHLEPSPGTEIITLPIKINHIARHSDNHGPKDLGASITSASHIQLNDCINTAAVVSGMQNNQTRHRVEARAGRVKYSAIAVFTG